jgi:hypothetical protein
MEQCRRFRSDGGDQCIEMIELAEELLHLYVAGSRASRLELAKRVFECRGCVANVGEADRPATALYLVGQLNSFGNQLGRWAAGLLQPRDTAADRVEFDSKRFAMPCDQCLELVAHAKIPFNLQWNVFRTAGFT